MPSYNNSFKVIRRSTHCPYARSAKISYAPEWDDGTNVIDNLTKTIKSLVLFTEFSKTNPLDGYVINAPGSYGDTLNKLANFTSVILTFYSDHDPALKHCMRENILNKEWQFNFNNTKLFVITFSSCYPDDHARSTFGEFVTTILLQPEKSFHEKHIPRGSNHKMIRERIRHIFAQHNKKYDSAILDSHYEAYRYVKPLNWYDAPVKWWESSNYNKLLPD